MENKAIIGLVLVVVSAFLLFISLIRKREAFFNIRETVCEHLKVFKHCPSKYLIFYVFPLGFSVGLSMIYEAGERFYSELSVVLGIILSMLFAILSILTAQDYSDISDPNQKNLANKVLKQTTNAIVFDSILSLSLMLYGLVIIVLSGVKTIEIPFDLTIVKSIVAGVAYYIFTIILLNLLFIVKQMSKIISFNIEVKNIGEKNQNDKN